MENKYYFGYYCLFGSVGSVKGVEEMDAKPLLQKHTLTEEEFKLPLSALAVKYPYRVLL